MNLAVRTATNTAMRLSHQACMTASMNLSRSSHNSDYSHEDNNMPAPYYKETHDFERGYVADKEATLKYLKTIHKVIDSTVQCVALRWVHIQYDECVELMDYLGNQRIITKESVVDAINSGKIEVINAEIREGRLVLLGN